MEKLFKKIIKNIAEPYLINTVDLIDFLLDFREKIDESNETFRYFQILKDIKDINEEWFYLASQNELIIMFDRIRDIIHHSNETFRCFFPNLKKSYFYMITDNKPLIKCDKCGKWKKIEKSDSFLFERLGYYTCINCDNKI